MAYNLQKNGVFLGVITYNPILEDILQQDVTTDSGNHGPTLPAGTSPSNGSSRYSTPGSNGTQQSRGLEILQAIQPTFNPGSPGHIRMDTYETYIPTVDGSEIRLTSW